MGGDAKYGRLYTQADVVAILRMVSALRDDGGSDGMSDAQLAALIPEPTFPADEPLFLLRGQDKAAPGAIAEGRNYLDECSHLFAPVEHLHAVSEAHEGLVRWQAANPERIKVPD